MDGAENNQVTTPDNDAVMTSLLASLGLGAFQSVDALLLSEMDEEEFESPHIEAGRAAAGVSCKWSLCRYFKCVWMVLGVGLYVDVGMCNGCLSFHFYDTIVLVELDLFIVQRGIWGVCDVDVIVFGRQCQCYF